MRVAGSIEEVEVLDLNISLCRTATRDVAGCRCSQYTQDEIRAWAYKLTCMTNSSCGRHWSSALTQLRFFEVLVVLSPMFRVFSVEGVRMPFFDREADASPGNILDGADMSRLNAQFHHKLDQTFYNSDIQGPA